MMIKSVLDQSGTQAMAESYTSNVCRHIVWAIVCVRRYFFSKVKLCRDLKNSVWDDPPKSLLDLSIDRVIYANIIDCPNLGWEFRFWIPIPGTTGIRNSASENGIPELSGGKNPKIYGGNRFRHSKKKKKKAGTFFSDRNRKRNRKNRLKKTTGIRNSAEFRRNSGGIPNQGGHFKLNFCK